MLRRARALLPALMVIAGALACPPERLPDDDIADEKSTCAALVGCWYPGDSGSRFDDAGTQWAGLAAADNERNIRNAYGPDGTCWQADPMAGTGPNGDTVDPEELAYSCGVACGCAIVELCAARAADPTNAGLKCSDDDAEVAVGPCEPDMLELANDFCGEQ